MSWDDEAYDRDSYKRADFLDELLERLVIREADNDVRDS